MVIKMEAYKVDELLLYRGEDIVINDKIKLHIPTLDEICKYGEQAYYSMVYNFTSVGADLKWQLDKIGVDYTKINDFELFYTLLSKQYSKEKTFILFGELDWMNFEHGTNTANQEALMYDRKNNIIVDEYTYNLIMSYLRNIHNLKRNSQLPANETTKKILIEDAYDEYLANKTTEYHSQLLPLISAMTNSSGFKYNHNNVWALKINVFMDCVKRIAKIQNSRLLLQSGYSGYGIDLKKIDQKQLDWTGELD